MSLRDASDDGKGFPGLTMKELTQACSNIGFDLTCGACACVFFTGHGGVYPHDDACKTNRSESDKGK